MSQETTKEEKKRLRTEQKAERQRKTKETQEKMEQTGKSIQRTGCMLTGLITLPIIGIIVAGPVGLVGGIIIGGVIFWAVRKQAKQEG